MAITSQPHVCLITGASGLLGRAVMRIFSQAGGWKVVGLAYARADKNPQYVKCDINNSEQLQAVFDSHKPHVVVHCAAERRPDVVEHQTEMAEKLNVEGSERIADACKRTGAFLLYISTDYVFDGQNPPYAETATPNPINTYGRLKLLGEQAVLKTHPNFTAVLRVPILYGPLEYLDESAVTVLFGKLLEAKRLPTHTTCKPFPMNDYETRYPTHVDDVAAAALFLASLRINSGNTGGNAETSGIFHWGNSREPMTKFGMVEIMARVLNFPMDHIVADATPSAGTNRPKDARLSCDRLQQLGFKQSTPFEQGIQPVLLPFVE